MIAFCIVYYEKTEDFILFPGYCRRCGITCPSLSRHKCTALRSGVCNICAKNCPSLDDHMCDKVSLANQNHQCTECQLSFSTSLSYIKHMKLHKRKLLPEPPHRCTSCGEHLQSESFLRAHARLCGPEWKPKLEKPAPPTLDVNDVRSNSVVGNGSGRPPKDRSMEVLPPKRPRGRPRKQPIAPEVLARLHNEGRVTRGKKIDVSKMLAECDDDDDQIVKRGRGRPPKTHLGLEIISEAFKAANNVDYESVTFDGNQIYLRIEDEQLDDNTEPALEYEKLSNSNYRCCICQSEFTNEDSVREHTERHTREAFCSQCNGFFPDVNDFIDHGCDRDAPAQPLNDESTSDQIPGQKCPCCDEEFQATDVFNQHMIVEHSELLNCVKCNTVFINNQTMDGHICPSQDTESQIAANVLTENEQTNAESSSEYILFNCTICDRTFNKKLQFLNHQRRCQLGQTMLDSTVPVREWPCPVCDKVFKSEVKLENHSVLHEGWFKCRTCFKQFSSQLGLDTHQCVTEPSALVDIDNPDIEKPYVCGECEKRFKSQLFLNLHTTRHAHKFVCEMCKRTFRRSLELEDHKIKCQAKVDIETNGLVICNHCSQTFTDAVVFKKHLQVHTSPYFCNKCLKPYKYLSSLQQHERICQEETDNKEQVQCTVCKKIFPCAVSLTRHMIFHKHPRFHCLYCKRRFHRKDYYNIHVCRRPAGVTTVTSISNLNQTNPTQHKCKICQKTFISAGNLNKHMILHTEKKFQCEVCHKKFHYISALQVHQRWTHSRALEAQCGQCGKMLKSAVTLRSHIRICHQPPTQSFPCTLCPKRFRSKGNLIKHQNKHTNEKSYKCDICPAVYKYPEQLSKHKTEHEHGRRYVCGECQKTFIKEYDLKKHLNDFHTGQIYVCEVCSVECKQVNTLKRHIRRRHPEKLFHLSDKSYIASMQKYPSLGPQELRLQEWTYENVTNVETISENTVSEDNAAVSSAILQQLAQSGLTVEHNGQIITVSSLEELTQLAESIGDVQVEHRVGNGLEHEEQIIKVETQAEDQNVIEMMDTDQQDTDGNLNNLVNTVVDGTVNTSVVDNLVVDESDLQLVVSQ